jgi:hypothetical protein
MYQLILDNAASLRYLLPLAAAWLVCAGLCAYTAYQRGESALKWLLWGLLGAPIALVASLRAGKVCPHCRKKIHRRARICPYCQLPQTYKYLSNDFRPHPEGLIANGDDGDF